MAFWKVSPLFICRGTSFVQTQQNLCMSSRHMLKSGKFEFQLVWIKIEMFAFVLFGKNNLLTFATQFLSFALYTRLQ